MDCISLNKDFIVDYRKTFAFENYIKSLYAPLLFFFFYFLSKNKLYLFKDILSFNIYSICQTDLVQFFFFLLEFAFN